MLNHFYSDILNHYFQTILQFLLVLLFRHIKEIHNIQVNYYIKH